MRCLSQGTVDVEVMGSRAAEWTGYPAVKCAEIRERVGGRNGGENTRSWEPWCMNEVEGSYVMRTVPKALRTHGCGLKMRYAFIDYVTT
jgi:hypothetical protein